MKSSLPALTSEEIFSETDVNEKNAFMISLSSSALSGITFESDPNRSLIIVWDLRQTNLNKRNFMESC